MLRLADPLTNFIPMLLFLLNIFLAYSLWRSPAGIRKLSRLAALAALVFGLTDWLMLAALPRLNLSYGPVNPAWCLLLVGRIMVLLFMAGALKGLFRLHPRVRTHRTVLGALILWGAINIMGSAVVFDSLYIEPFRLQITRISLTGPTFLPERPLRILQISDTHIERITQREGMCSPR